jgi:Replication protein C C-terminal region.
MTTPSAGGLGYQREIRTLLATAAAEQVPGDWTTYQADFVPISRQVPRSITFEAAAILAGALEQLVTKVRSCLVDHVERHKLTSTARHSDEYKQNSTPEPNSDFEPGFANGPGRPEEPHPEAKNPPYEAHYPLGMVLDACQNLGVYSTRPIASWSDFTATVETIRPYLGISPSAWDEAKETFGLRQAAVSARLRRISARTAALETK